jgi:2-amino-4-hydroxy-6-hydroxymethyldihydropteridine diphosphokinase
MADVLIGLGGNVGDVRASFARAIPLIVERTGATLVARSSDYETPPWGDTAQAPFVNACIRLETEIAPRDLLRALHEVEALFGRDRARERRWGPRPLDLDLLAYDNLTLAGDELNLPHPRLFERAFVLVPLAEIAPDRNIGGQTPARALKGVSTEGIRRLPPHTSSDD